MTDSFTVVLSVLELTRRGVYVCFPAFFKSHLSTYITKSFGLELLALPKVTSFPIENGLRIIPMSQNKHE